MESVTELCRSTSNVDRRGLPRSDGILRLVNFASSVGGCAPVRGAGCDDSPERAECCSISRAGSGLGSSAHSLRAYFVCGNGTCFLLYALCCLGRVDISPVENFVWNRLLRVVPCSATHGGGEASRLVGWHRESDTLNVLFCGEVKRADTVNGGGSIIRGKLESGGRGGMFHVGDGGWFSWSLWIPLTVY